MSPRGTLNTPVLLLNEADEPAAPVDAVSPVMSSRAEVASAALVVAVAAEADASDALVVAVAAEAALSAAFVELVAEDDALSAAFVVLVAAELADEVADAAAAFCEAVTVASEFEASDALEAAESRAASAAT